VLTVSVFFVWFVVKKADGLRTPSGKYTVGDSFFFAADRRRRTQTWLPNYFLSGYVCVSLRLILNQSFLCSQSVCLAQRHYFFLPQTDADERRRGCPNYFLSAYVCVSLRLILNEHHIVSARHPERYFRMMPDTRI